MAFYNEYSCSILICKISDFWSKPAQWRPLTKLARFRSFPASGSSSQWKAIQSLCTVTLSPGESGKIKSDSFLQAGRTVLMLGGDDRKLWEHRGGFFKICILINFFLYRCSFQTGLQMVQYQLIYQVEKKLWKKSRSWTLNYLHFTCFQLEGPTYVSFGHPPPREDTSNMWAAVKKKSFEKFHWNLQLGSWESRHTIIRSRDGE